MDWSVANIVTPNCTQVGYRAVLCPGRVVIVTGAGRGIGREHALAFAREGANVVVNDLGVASDGSGGDRGPAQDVVDEIVAAGGDAVANTDDIADWDGARHLVASSDRHVRRPRRARQQRRASSATACCSRRARKSGTRSSESISRDTSRRPVTRASTGGRSRKPAKPVDARIINTSSGAGLMGSVGQGTYSAAKAGIAALTLVEAAEMGRYGVDRERDRPGGAHAHDRSRSSPTAWPRPTAGSTPTTRATCRRSSCGSAAPNRRGVTGRVFEVEGGIISVADGWQHGPQVDKGARWEPSEVGAAVEKLLADRSHRRRRSTARSSRARRARRRCRRAGARKVRGPTRHSSTASRRLIATISRSSTEASDSRSRTSATRSTATPHSSGSSACDRAPSSRGSCRTGGKPSCSVGRSGAAARSRARSRRACARTRSASSCARPAHASWPCRTRSAAPTTARCSREAGFDGAVLAVRDGSPLASRPPRQPSQSTSTIAPSCCGHRARPPIRRVSCTPTRRCATRPTASPPRTRCAPAKSLLLPMPVTHVAGLTYGLLLPVTSGITAVLMDTWDPGCRARARWNASASR